ncbi:putative leucine-rich repeat-containing protein DDB_G0290503 isoform X2 [Eurytemora carolleeae]|uniref:putative leucine-rich repeat-containing protein DDB_G0290503 isoform X2 n=1 Tax=Eurytemora carolleeae TaxID=1294199 RepID=UPI000C772C72|nr:putative leucine-rich repeat-containing protein DDB_G0290503 isoform X2 [Eurytemora carolleeae]|eukprot:XP_023349253.1 putative leucine-rich repeat-containing protein DDB_G0290503 isoform X2 [Eurytemora affinis]
MKSKMINIKDFDFHDLLDSTSNLHDVEFKIIDENFQELGTVRSHKFLLSLLSPVLKKMFSSREEGSIVVEITGPSFISFQTLIQFLYTGDESVITDISSIDDLFDLYYLGDKYELRGARNLIKEVVSSFKINQENWIHVLKGIKKYENTFLFEDLCNILQDQVQGYLKGCPSSDEYLDDIQESDDTDFYSWVKNWIQKWRRSDTGLQEADFLSPESELKDLKILIQNMKYQHEELIQTTQQKDKMIEELKLKQEELIRTTEQKDKRIEELELKQEELIQTTQQKDKRIEELELKHEELIQTTQQKTKRIEELELKQEELIQTTQQNDKRIEELELKQEELIQTTQQKDKRIEELELKHEELIQTTQQKTKRIEELELKQEELIQTTQQNDKRIEELKLKQEELIQTTQQKDKRIEELELKHEELIQTTEQKDKRIEELELKHEELIQTTQQKDKRIEELELYQNDLQHDLQTKDRKIQNLESQHEEFIKNTEQKLRMMKEIKGKADFKVVYPVCLGCSGSNIPLENMFEHMKSCKFIEFDESHLKLNTEVMVNADYHNIAYKLEESRDWFIIKIRNDNKVFYIMHHSEEETKNVFYYNIKYYSWKNVDDKDIIKSVTVRCAPMGILPKDAVHNNFTTNIPIKVLLEEDVKFTMYKA